MLVAAGLITWLILCWTFSRLCYQRTRPQRLVQQSALQSQQPIPQGQAVGTNSITTCNTDETGTVQHRNDTLRFPIKSQHIYDYVVDISIDTCKPAEPLNSECCKPTSVVSPIDTNYKCNVVKRETYLNPYHTLKDKRETKIHDYSGIDTNKEDSCKF